MSADTQSKQTVNVLLYNNDPEYAYVLAQVRNGMRRYCEQKGFTSGKTVITVDVITEVNVTQVTLTFEKNSEYLMCLMQAGERLIRFNNDLFVLPGFFSRLRAEEGEVLTWDPNFKTWPA